MNTDFIELLDIDDITYDNIDVNTYDLTIEDDASFIFSNGIISHNSAAGGIRNNKTDKLGVFPLRGKPLSCLETPLTKILNNKEFKNIRIITGLQIGVPLVEKFDGDWYEIIYKNKFLLVLFHVLHIKCIKKLKMLLIKKKVMINDRHQKLNEN